MTNKKGKKKLSKSDMKKVKGGHVSLSSDGFGLMEKGLQELEDTLLDTNMEQGDSPTSTMPEDL